MHVISCGPGLCLSGGRPRYTTSHSGAPRAAYGPDGSRGRIDKRERKRMAAAQAEKDIAEDQKLGATRTPVVGYHYASSNRVLDVKECPVLAPELEKGIETIRTAITGMPRREWPYQVEGSCGVEGASYSPDLPGMRKDLVEHEVLGFRYLIEPESFFGKMFASFIASQLNSNKIR